MTGAGLNARAGTELYACRKPHKLARCWSFIVCLPFEEVLFAGSRNLSL